MITGQKLMKQQRCQTPKRGICTHRFTHEDCSALYMPKVPYAAACRDKEERRSKIVAIC